MDDSFRGAVLIFAHLIGIDIDNEQPLLKIAEEALSDLPDGWLLGYGEGEHENVPFFFNELTEESVWHHPNEAMYISRVTAERQKIKAKLKQTDNAVTVKKEESVVEVMEVEEFDDFDDSPVKSKEQPAEKKGTGSALQSKDTAVPVAATQKGVKELPANEKNDAGRGEASLPSAKTQKEVPPLKTSKDNVKFSSNSQDANKGWSDNGSKNNSARTSRDRDAEREESNRRNADKVNEEKRQREREMEERREAERREADRRNKEIQRETEERKRESERREADRRRDEKERALEEERDRVAKGSLSSKESAAKYEGLQGKFWDLQQRYRVDCEELEAQLDKMEARLKEEKRERKSLEERLVRAEDDLDRQTKEADDLTEGRARETARRTRIEIEDEWKEKLRSVEKRHELDIMELRGELSSGKRRIEDLQREVELQKQRALNSKEDARLEAMADVEGLHKRSLEMEDLLHAEQREVRKVRGDHAALAGKLTSALQMLQLTKAERDAAQAEAHTAVSEGQVNHVALLQSTKRMQQVESEIATYRAEVAILRKENDSLTSALRKTKEASVLNSAAAASSVNESTSAAEKIETNHYISRISELQVMNSMLNDQVGSIDIREAAAVRQVKTELEKALSELSACKRKVMELESQMEGDASKVHSLQMEISSLSDSLRSREQKIGEQQLRLEAERRLANEAKSKMQFELEEAQREMYILKAEHADKARKHASEMDTIRNEISVKIPQIASTAVENAEKQWMHRLARECDNIKQGYELQLRRISQEIVDQKEMAMDKEAHYQSTQGKDRNEISRLRQQIDMLRKENETCRLEVSDYRDSAVNMSRSRVVSREDHNTSSYDRNQAMRDNEMMMVLQSNLNSMRAQLSDSLVAGRRETAPSSGARMLGELDSIKREYSRNNVSADDVSFAPDATPSSTFRSAFQTPKATSPSDATASSNVSSTARFDLGYPYDFSKSFSSGAAAAKAQDFTFPDSMVGSGMHEGLWRFKYLSH